MRYSSVESTEVAPRRLRRRLGFLVWHRCRRPALERTTLPLAVILNRLAADFFVLMPLGRRINNQLSFKKSAEYRSPSYTKQAVIFAYLASISAIQTVCRDTSPRLGEKSYLCSVPGVPL